MLLHKSCYKYGRPFVYKTSSGYRIFGYGSWSRTYKKKKLGGTTVFLEGYVD